MFDSILETMRALTDPLVLFEEAEDTLLSMKEVSRSTGRTTDGRKVDADACFRAPAGRSFAAHPAGGAPRQGLGRDHRAGRGQGAAARAGAPHPEARAQARHPCGPAARADRARRPPAPARPRSHAASRRSRRWRSRAKATTLVEINPHAFPSDMLGESQRNIMRLLTDTIPEIAARRPHTVVLIDEVESFAVRRNGLVRDQPGRRAPRHRRGDARHRRGGAQASGGALRDHHELHRRDRRGVPVARRPGDALRAAGSWHDRPHPA